MEKPMKLTPQQNAIVRWVGKSKGHLNVVARAGCGKTTTLLALVEEIIEQYPTSSTFLGAFNKAIATEIQDRLKGAGVGWRQAEAGTMHSIGFRLWRKAHPKVEVDENKVRNIIQQRREAVGGVDSENVYVVYGAAIRVMVSLAKQSGFGWAKAHDNPADWLELMERFGIELSEDAPALTAQDVAAAAIYVLGASYSMDHTVIDFDDMITAPLKHGVPVRYPYDFVLIDEAQDTNAARRALATKLLRPITGRLVAVGDDRQAIYGFTGADSTAMDLIRQQLNSATLPLTVTYRCPKAVVAVAQRYVPDIQAHPSAPEGSVTSMPLNGKLPAFKPTDAVLCRNTAPLIEMAFKLIGEGKPCRVEGRDIGKSLEVLARKWKVQNLEELGEKLVEYFEREQKRLLEKGHEERVAALEDKVASLHALIGLCHKQGKHGLQDLLALIDEMFGDTPNGARPDMLTLSTVHKAKGREWPRVFILRAGEFMPSRWARKEWQVQQEENLIYVAVTRAKQELVYLG